MSVRPRLQSFVNGGVFENDPEGNQIQLQAILFRYLDKTIDFVECTFPELSAAKYNPMLDGVRLFRDGPIVNLMESNSAEAAQACVLERTVEETAINKKQVTICQKTRSEIPSANGIWVQQEGGQLAATPDAVSSDDDEEDIALQGRLSSCVIESASFLEQATNASLLDSDCNWQFNEQENGSGLKLYQIRLQDLLQKQLDKTFAAFFHESSRAELTERDDSDNNELVGIRLFKNAPLITSTETRDISLKDEQITYKRRKSLLRRRLHIDKSCLHTVAVDGVTIISEAEEAAKKALVALDTAVMAAKEAANKEEERVSILKKKRGEAWLPSLAP